MAQQEPVAGQVLARARFRVAPRQQDVFAEEYDRLLLPVLKSHGLLPAQEVGRTPAPGWFCRLLEAQGAAQVAAAARALEADLRWRKGLEGVGRAAGWAPGGGSSQRVGPGARGAPSAGLGMYRAPARLGEGREAGMGSRTGPWLRLGVQDGFPAAHVYGMAEQASGIIWFATSRGLCRFDGAEFITLGARDGLPCGEVCDCVVDAAGHVWAATARGGICRYDGHELATYDQADGLAPGKVHRLLSDGAGRLYAGCENGLSLWSRDGIRTWGPEQGIPWPGAFALAAGVDGDIWASCGRDGIARLTGEALQSYTTAEGLPTNWVGALLVDGDGRLWIGCCGGPVTCLDGAKVTYIGVDEGLSNTWLFSLALDAGNRLWAGTQGTGACLLQDGRFRTYTTDSGLQSNVVRCMLCDHLGRMWFGGLGVTRYDEPQVKIAPAPKQFPSLDVYSLAMEREGSLLVGTRDGLCRWDGTVWVDTLPEPRNVVASMVPCGDGTVWLGALFQGGGVFRLGPDGVCRITAPTGTFADYVTSIAVTGDGRLWAATREGLRRVTADGFEIEGIPADLTTAPTICVSPGAGHDLWVGTNGLGAAHWSGATCSWLTQADGLPSNTVNAIARDMGGRLWLATAEGVACLEGGVLTTYTVGDGLPHDEVASFLADSGGHLWFATFGGGVGRYDGTVFQRLTEGDGLPGGTVRQVVEGLDGSYWVASEGGLVQYRPCSEVPVVRIRGVVTNRRQEVGQPLEANAGETVAFEVTGCSPTTHPSRLAFTCQLEGYDGQPRVSYARRIEYPGLSEGTYTFRVRAVDRDLNYSEPTEVIVAVGPDPRSEALAQALSVQIDTHSEFVGESRALRAALAQLAEVARTDLTVLILGETGTGKGLAARFVHANSPGAAGPFIQVNCGAMPEGLVESELFGHEKGAFTGATSRKLGKAELAAGGTLFLDEIGDLATAAQVKLLRLLEEHTFERVGGTATLKTDVRVIAATNRDLRAMVSEGRFRQDLYYRLEAFPIRLPPLRERREDIPLLAAYFTERMASHLSREPMPLSGAALAALVKHDWPGNVRELEHALQRAVIVCRGTEIQAAAVSLDYGATETTPSTGMSLAEAERSHIRRVLEAVAWRVRGPGGAAALLGVAESTLRSRMKKLGIQRPG